MYYIYHIEGVKIGCSIQPEKRVNNQGYSNYSILESHTNINIAAKREIELQKQYGYVEDTIHTNYVQHLEFQKAGANACKGKPNKGASTQIKNKIGIWAMSEEERNKVQKNASKYGGIAQSQIERTCPHCGKVGKGNGMFGAHFNRCKLINE